MSIKKRKSKTEHPQDIVGSSMSLGDHLEELRMRLIYALLGLGVGVLVSLVFGRAIIGFMEGPYNDATAKLLFSTELKFQSDLEDGVVSEGLQEEFKDNGSALSANVKVKQKGYLFSGKRWLIDDDKGRYIVKEEEGELNIYELVPLQVIAVAAGFVSYIKICLITGLLLTSPWVFYHLWMFISAGLYSHEKRYVHLAAPFSAVLFVIGALFFLAVVAPLTLKFLVKFNERMLDVKSQFTFQHYISFISHLMLVFGIAFQTPAAIFFLNRTGLVSIQALNRSRKYIVLVIVIVAAMATPPDLPSQITLAVPLYLLFELGIFLSWFASRKRAAAD